MVGGQEYVFAPLIFWLTQQIPKLEFAIKPKIHVVLGKFSARYISKCNLRTTCTKFEDIGSFINAPQQQSAPYSTTIPLSCLLKSFIAYIPDIMAVMSNQGIRVWHSNSVYIISMKNGHFPHWQSH